MAPVVAAPIAAAPVLAAPAAGVSAPDFNNSLTPQEVEQFRKYMREKSGSKAVPPTEARNTPAPANAARLTVKLPADAKLWVDHVECPLTSAVRSFNTPALPPGQTFAYTLKVEVNRDGQTLTDTQRVRVTAGQRVNVDFSNVDRVATASR